MDKIKTHKDLILWNRGVSFVSKVYAATSNFPRDELYGLTNQIRRSVVSIPSNIAEGYGRKSTKELIQFLHIALGSISELDTQLLISKNLSFLEETKYQELLDELTELSKMTAGLINNLVNKLKQ